MTYLTPLELSLEADLERIGLPLGGRNLIYQSALDDFLLIQSMPQLV